APAAGDRLAMLVPPARQLVDELGRAQEGGAAPDGRRVTRVLGSEERPQRERRVPRAGARAGVAHATGVLPAPALEPGETGAHRWIGGIVRPQRQAVQHGVHRGEPLRAALVLLVAN